MTVKKTSTEKAAVYSIAQLADASEKVFGARKIIVRAALKTSGKDQFTEKEAVKIVEAFRTKEVK